jgi:NitT/TauT family transport system substrate-binding protein
VSQAEGYFEEEGIEVEDSIVDGTGSVIQQMVAGRGDIGTVGPSGLLASTQEGATLPVVYQIDHENIFAIVTPSDSGITEVADLEGETLGITSPAGGEVPTVDAALSEAGLEKGSDVEVVSVGDGGPQVAEALESGRIAAYSGGDADTLALQQLGTDLTNILPEKYTALPGNSLAVSSDFLEENRDVAVRFLRAWAKGTQFAIENQEAALEYGCDFAPENCTDMEFARLAIKYYVELQVPPEDEFGNLSESGWETTAEIMIQEDLLEEGFDALEVLDPSLLDDVNDFDREDIAADAEGA